MYEPGEGVLKPWLMCPNIKWTNHDILDVQKQTSAEVLGSLQVKSLHVPSSACVYMYTYRYTYIHISSEILLPAAR